jgi:hypothetical protein
MPRESLNTKHEFEDNKNEIIRLLNDEEGGDSLLFSNISTALEGLSADNFSSLKCKNFLYFLRNRQFNLTDYHSKIIQESAIYNKNFIDRNPHLLMPFLEEFFAVLPDMKILINCQLISLNSLNQNRYPDGAITSFNTFFIMHKIDEQTNRERSNFMNNKLHESSSSAVHFFQHATSSFFLTIENNKIITFPNKEISQIYPTLIKSIFKNSGILTPVSAEGYKPLFTNEAQAEKFLILLCKLAVSNNILDLEEAKKDQLKNFFKKIDDLSIEEEMGLNRLLEEPNLSCEDLFKINSSKNKIIDLLKRKSLSTDYSLFYKEICEYLTNTKDSIFNHERFNDFIKFMEQDNSQIDSYNYANLILIKLNSLLGKKFKEKHESINRDDVESEFIQNFQLKINNLLGTNFNFSNSPINKDSCLIIDKLLNKFSVDQFSDNKNSIYKQNLINFFLQFDSFSANDFSKYAELILQLSKINQDSARLLNQGNNIALAQFHIIISAQRSFASQVISNSRKVTTENTIAVQEDDVFGAGVFNSHADENRLALGQPKADSPDLNITETNIFESTSLLPSYQLFLKMIEEDDNSIEFSRLAGKDIDNIMKYLFLGKGDEELIKSMGEINFSFLKNIIETKAFRAIPKQIDGNSQFYYSQIQQNPDHQFMGMRLDDSGFSMGIYRNNDLKLKLGIKISNGVVSKGLFDDRGNLIIDSKNIPELLGSSQIDYNSFVKASCGNRGLNGIFYDTKPNLYSLKCINNKWWIGIFSAKNIDIALPRNNKSGDNLDLEFKGAVIVNDGILLSQSPLKVKEIMRDLNKVESQETLAPAPKLVFKKFESDDVSSNALNVDNMSSIIERSNSSLSRTSSISSDLSNDTNFSESSLRDNLLEFDQDNDNDNEEIKTSFCCGLFERLTRKLSSTTLVADNQTRINPNITQESPLTQVLPVPIVVEVTSGLVLRAPNERSVRN